MGVSRDEVLRVAALARLELSDDEVDSLVRELDEILGHVEGLGHRAAMIEDRAANYEPRTTNYERREGESAGGDSLSGGVEGIAPDFRDGFFRVPRLGSHEGTGARTGTGGHTQPHTHREQP